MCLEFFGSQCATFLKPLQTSFHCRDEECECLASTGACLDQKVARTRSTLGVVVFQELRKEREDGRLDGRHVREPERRLDESLQNERRGDTLERLELRLVVIRYRWLLRLDLLHQGFRGLSVDILLASDCRFRLLKGGGLCVLRAYRSEASCAECWTCASRQ